MSERKVEETTNFLNQHVKSLFKTLEQEAFGKTFFKHEKVENQETTGGTQIGEVCYVTANGPGATPTPKPSPEAIQKEQLKKLRASYKEALKDMKVEDLEHLKKKLETMLDVVSLLQDEKHEQINVGDEVKFIDVYGEPFREDMEQQPDLAKKVETFFKGSSSPYVLARTLSDYAYVLGKIIKKEGDWYTMETGFGPDKKTIVAPSWCFRKYFIKNIPSPVAI